MPAEQHNEDSSTCVASNCGKGGMECAGNGFNWSTSYNCKGQTVYDLYRCYCLDPKSMNIFCKHGPLQPQYIRITRKEKKNTDHTERNNDIILNKFIDKSVKNSKL